MLPSVRKPPTHTHPRVPIVVPCRLVLGDIILGINGKKIDTASDLYRILDKAAVGDQVRGCCAQTRVLQHPVLHCLYRILDKVAVGGPGGVEGECPQAAAQGGSSARHADLMFYGRVFLFRENDPTAFVVRCLQLDVEVLRLDSKQHLTITLEAST
jgi:hypothetical protein